MKIFGLRLNQIAFLVASLGILASLPWLSSWGVWLWLLANLIFILGVVLVLLNK